MIRSIIIDDMASIREQNADLIRKHCPDVAILAEADSVKSGVETIRKFMPDLVFLDVEMDDGTGFDLLRHFPSIPFKVIFVTGYQEFAITAFRFSAIDFLLKPVDPDDLVEAVRKAGESIGKDLLELKFQTLFLNMAQPKHPQNIILRTVDKVYPVAIPDIVYCEAEKNYTTFHMANGQSCVVSTTLKDYSTMLSPMGFFRSHQSHLINLAYFDFYSKKDGLIIMKDGAQIPLATRKKEEFLALISAM